MQRSTYDIAHLRPYGPDRIFEKTGENLNRSSLYVSAHTGPYFLDVSCYFLVMYASVCTEV